MLQILLFLLSFLHPFYVSVTEIKFNQKNKVVEVSSRMFFDDFERALEKQYHEQLDILKPVDRSKVDRLISDYLKKHLQLTIDGRKVQMSYLGYEIEEDGAWCYFEIRGISSVKQISVADNILFEEHPSQINMVHTIVNGVRKSTKLDNPASQAAFTF